MTPVEVSDELTSRLRDHLSEKQVVELTNLIAWENARARFNRGFGIEADGYNRDEGTTDDGSPPGTLEGLAES